MGTSNSLNTNSNITPVGSPSSSPPEQSANTSAPKMTTDQKGVVMHVINQPTSSPEPSSLPKRVTRLGHVTPDPLVIVMINQYGSYIKTAQTNFTVEKIPGFAQFCKINKLTRTIGDSIWPIFLLGLLGLTEDENMRNKINEIPLNEVQEMCKELYINKNYYNNKSREEVFQKLVFFAAKKECNMFLKFLLESNLIDPNAIEQGYQHSLFDIAIKKSIKHNNVDVLRMLFATEGFILSELQLRELQRASEDAAKMGKDAVVRFLITSGLLEPNTINRMLDKAIMARHEDLVEPLLAAGATNVTEALFFAARRSQVNTVKAFFESGADIRSINSNVNVLMETVWGIDYDPISDRMDRIKTVNLILQQLQQKGINVSDYVNAKIDHGSWSGRTALIFAIIAACYFGFTKEDFQIIKTLLDHGASASIDSRDQDFTGNRSTALMKALLYPNHTPNLYNYKIIKLLIDSGATLTKDDHTKIFEKATKPDSPPSMLRMYNFAETCFSEKEKKQKEKK